MVLDPDRKHVAGAAVVVGFDSDDAHRGPQGTRTVRHILETDASGRFSCPAPAGSGPIALYACKTGLAPVALQSWKDAGKEFEPIVMRLPRSEPFRAKLLDRHGKPVSGAEVRLTRLAIGPTVMATSARGQTVSVCYETINGNIVAGSPVATVYSAKTDAHGTVVFPALREKGGVQYDAIVPGKIKEGLEVHVSAGAA